MESCLEDETGLWKNRESVKRDQKGSCEPEEGRKGTVDWTNVRKGMSPDCGSGGDFMGVKRRRDEIG